MYSVQVFAVLLQFTVAAMQAKLKSYKFPEHFQFGVATAAYQIEGAWNVSGKGESIWDRATHDLSKHHIADKSNGDIACDSYHHYKEDVQLVHGLGAKIYRFSISWPRILPTGKLPHVNEAGIRYYNDLIDEVLKYNLTPWVTMYHWDLPQTLQDEGGWTNRSIVAYFLDYAKVLLDSFGDRVKHWITINEPYHVCESGYGNGMFAPFIKASGVLDYVCGHNLLLAHAKTYRLYETRYKTEQKGQMGITIDTFWYEPNKENSHEDKLASETTIDMTYGWFVEPVIFGDYPLIMKKRVSERSTLEGRSTSRLPEFTEIEKLMLKGSLDFLGLNHYTTRKVSFISRNNTSSSVTQTSYTNDIGVEYSVDGNWPVADASWLRVVPWGLRRVLLWIRDRYGNPPVIITENGYADHGQLHDVERVKYLNAYLSQVLEAIHDDKCNVFGYLVWSLLDNFEWTDGYKMKFGICQVDFNDPKRKRTPKLSYSVYKEIVKTRCINSDYQSKCSKI